MHPFVYQRAMTAETAVRFAGMGEQGAPPLRTSYLAGGTTLVDLMRLGVMQPDLVVDINPLSGTSDGRIVIDRRGLRLGALVHMSEAADHPDIQAEYPIIAQSLKLAANAQLRNMATLGGNVLQRTRCTYFRDISYKECNKRAPGSGCAAISGVNRMHAVLGTSDHCIATYPGDFAQALIALDASVELTGPNGTRTIPFASLHRKPEDRPDQEIRLRPGELIVAFRVPATPWARRSLFLKIRDRESFEFALAAAAVALDQQEGIVRTARIALGGVATVPWRAVEAETLLAGKSIDEQNAAAAADAAFAGAKGFGHNDFKIELGKRTLIRALQQAAALQI